MVIKNSERFIQNFMNKRAKVRILFNKTKFLFQKNYFFVAEVGLEPTTKRL